MSADEQILEELRKIREILEKRGEDALENLPDWIALPDHLRKTFFVMLKFHDANAYDVCGETKRARAVESGYLNQLVTMGYLTKERRGRIVWFSLAGKYK